MSLKWLMCIVANWHPYTHELGRGSSNGHVWVSRRTKFSSSVTTTAYSDDQYASRIGQLATSQNNILSSLFFFSFWMSEHYCVPKHMNFWNLVLKWNEQFDMMQLYLSTCCHWRDDKAHGSGYIGVKMVWIVGYIHLFVRLKDLML